MSFEKTKAAADAHTEEEVKKEERDLNEEEDTSAESGQSAENETGSEEDTSTNEATTDESEESDEGTSEVPAEGTLEFWKAKAEKAEEEKSHYQQGMISAKAKKRSADGIDSSATANSVDEQAVVKVLEKQNERKALKEVIDPKSANFLPELVDDNQYYEIIGYLPRNLDKSSPDGIHRALKLAVKSWKEDKGIKDTVPKKKVEASMATVKSSTSSGVTTQHAVAKGERKIIKKQSEGMKDWYN